MRIAARTAYLYIYNDIICDDDVTVYGLTGGGVEESVPPPSPIGPEQLMAVTSRIAGRCETSRPRARRRRRSVIPHMHRHALLLATPATAAAASVVTFRFHRYHVIRQRRDHDVDCSRSTLTVSAAVRVSPHSESQPIPFVARPPAVPSCSIRCYVILINRLSNNNCCCN